MKIKKLLLGLIPFFGLLVLCGCDLSKNTSGIIDCYSINVDYTDSSNDDNYNYNVSYSSVYEYKDEDGHLLYSGGYYTNGIKVYNTRYDAKSVAYKYTGFIGFLTYENNYYLNLNKMIIDEEIKYSEYLYEAEPENTKSYQENPNNKLAFQCAKKGYYKVDSYSNNTGIIYLDMSESSLSRHTYVKLGSDVTVTYTPKWF